MTETGWPLIPREVLPPPVPVAKRAERRPAGPVGSPPGRQLSMFGAETIEPSPADLAGLLAGPGQLGRIGGTARVSVRVDAAWRVHVLVGELVVRGLRATWEPVEDQEQDHQQADSVRPDAPTAENEANDTSPDTEEEKAEEKRPVFEVRTAYSRRLNGLALAWPDASAQLFLSGPRLRLWVAAAGGPAPGGYQLGLDPAKDRAVVDAALVRAGLAGRVSDDGRRYLITGRRRLRRLAELVGDRPSAAPDEFWPGGVGA
ncbi:hypothetical protein [Actinoplanes derwentensis]|uniref:Uncharacterized protein n=1 Tax=Actinoplanes derwentensis TaxID=113562 RepID=A0A1H2CPI4_9ACTN|nr:hypothetical protein [Actinoplanes derwentensis]GID83880.1 hypothetical protein Ade03nite_28040 [Actinoplanes derwentensis]SDT72435.1 hypothetical protein SAMN04489716_6409 [Actinoplanes derwentensis]